MEERAGSGGAGTGRRTSRRRGVERSGGDQTDQTPCILSEAGPGGPVQVHSHPSSRDDRRGRGGAYDYRCYHRSYQQEATATTAAPPHTR